MPSPSASPAEQHPDDWAVAAPHHLASRAGADTFAAGGNAVDAALAAAAVLAVVYPHQCSIGGDLIALVGLPDGTAHVLNASGRAPAALDVDAVRATHDRMPVDGALPVTVPGVVDGWHEAARRWGSRPPAHALLRAAGYARDGVPVSPGLSRALVEESPRLAGDPGLAEVFLRDGAPLGLGDVLVQPRLADTLDLLVAGGSDAFYRGPVATALVNTLRRRGSAVTDADFAAHRHTVEEPVCVPFGDETYLSSGGNTQGGFFLEGLREVGSLQRRLDERLDPLGEHAGLVASILVRLAAERDEALGDVGPGAQQPHGDTVAIVAADGDGHWVSIIQSVFHAFGSGILDPATGVVLHNRGAGFTLTPGSPGELTPGRRPPHTLMPVLVRDASGRFVGAHGTMGGRAQPQIHTHLALHLALGRNVTDAVTAPRWVIGRMEAGGPAGDGSQAPVVQIEASVPDAARAALEAIGLATVALPDADDGVGHAQVVRRVQGPEHPAGLRAASDPRADGAALTSEGRG